MANILQAILLLQLLSLHLNARERGQIGFCNTQPNSPASTFDLRCNRHNYTDFRDTHWFDVADSYLFEDITLDFIMAKVEKNWVLSKNEKFLFSEKLSDVTFVFDEGKLIYAHAHHLAFVSEVFETQLFGAMQERRIEIKDATFEDFQTFLRFLYTGELTLTLENMFQLAYLGKKYMITKVTELAATFFKKHSNSETHFWKLFRPKEIEYIENEQKDCLARLTRQFEENPLAYFGMEQFLSADEEIVGELVRNEKLEIKELDLYKAVLRWAEHQCKGDHSKLRERKGLFSNRSKLREKVESFIHALRLPTLSFADLTYGVGIASNDLFSQEEKQSVLCYYAEMYNVHMPFIKLPRHGSLDVLLATSNGYGDYSSTPTSTTFVPQAAFRLVGVICRIISKETRVSFELVKLNQETQKEESICTFGKGSVKIGVNDVLCPVEELYQLLPNTTYTLRATPGPGVQMFLYCGSFTMNNGTKCLHTPNEQEKHGIIAFSLLPA